MHIKNYNKYKNYDNKYRKIVVWEGFYEKD